MIATTAGSCESNTQPGEAQTSYMISIVIFGVLDEARSCYHVLLELAAPSLTRGPHWVFRMGEHGKPCSFVTVTSPEAPSSATGGLFVCSVDQVPPCPSHCGCFSMRRIWGQEVGMDPPTRGSWPPLMALGGRDETEGEETRNTLGCKLQAPGSLSVPHVT